MSRYKPPDQSVYRIPPPGSRVLAYVRFSGDDQDAASQESALRAWIAERGWTVWPGGWFLDAGKSGSTTDHRDAFHSMLHLCESLAGQPNRPAGVALWKLDRLGRNFLDVTKTKSTLRGLGYAVVSMADTLPEDPTLAPLLETLLDVQAQGYLAEISKNTKRGHALLRGMGYATGGFPPFGLMEAREPMGQRKSGLAREGVRWVADPEAAPRVLEAFVMKAAGATYRPLMRGPLAGVYRTKTALAPFFHRQGYVTAGVVPQALFDQVQAVILRRATRRGADNGKSIAGLNPLAGLIWCGCGARMVAEIHTNGYAYFRCAERERNPNTDCLQTRIAMSKVVEPLLDAILGAIDHQSDASTIAQAASALLDGENELRAKAASLTRDIADLSTSISRLLDVLERDGIEGVRERLVTREAERKRLTNELLLVQAEMASQRKAVFSRDEMVALIDELRQTRVREDIPDLRAIIALLVQRVTVRGRDSEVVWRPEARTWLAPIDTAERTG